MNNISVDVIVEWVPITADHTWHEEGAGECAAGLRGWIDGRVPVVVAGGRRWSIYLKWQPEPALHKLH